MQVDGLKAGEPNHDETLCVGPLRTKEMVPEGDRDQADHRCVFLENEILCVFRLDVWNCAS